MSASKFRTFPRFAEEFPLMEQFGRYMLYSTSLLQPCKQIDAKVVLVSISILPVMIWDRDDYINKSGIDFLV